LSSQNPANGWAIYINDVCVADEADTHSTARFDQRQLTLSYPSKEAEMNVEYIATIKSIKEVFSKRLDC
jgi:hypothetical protein